MAPLAPFGRASLFRLLRQPELDRRLPFKFGSPHPCVGVVRREGVLQLRDLVVDQAAMKAFSETELAAGRSFMPEHVTRFAHPTGTLHAEGKDVESFCAALAQLSWPRHW